MNIRDYINELFNEASAKFDCSEKLEDKAVELGKMKAYNEVLHFLNYEATRKNN